MGPTTWTRFPALHAAAELARDVTAGIVDALWAPSCWVCGAAASLRGAAPAAAILTCDRHALAPGLRGARCRRCADALPPGISPGSLCRRCRRLSPRFRAVLAGFEYDDGAHRDWLLALKHGGRMDLAMPLARATVASLAGAVEPSELPRAGDVLVPVPLHAARWVERGYNQSGRLAAEFALCGYGQVAPLLARVRATEPQGAGAATSRRANVRGAFRCRRRALPGDLRYWLVDDVLTTGATAHECARVLARAVRTERVKGSLLPVPGALDVRVLCIARASSRAEDDPEDPPHPGRW